MVIGKGKAIGLVVGTVLVPAAVVGSVFAASSKSLKPSKADAYSVTLNNTLQPTLNNAGDGTMADSKNITWEYHNAADYPSGHVYLNNGGYFGVSSSNSYGYTAISNITVNYTAGTDGELWLLRSVDGVNWSEAQMLKDVDDTSSTTVSTTIANNWRYVRFFFDYDTNNTPDRKSVV